MSAAREASRAWWRGVEAQHRVATLRLVDDIEEQRILEELLESSKPPVPPSAEGAHWLIFTPFRYPSPWASRFRRGGEPGLWYGADSPETVAAELAHWRWRFVTDSDGLRQQPVLTEHTFYRARFVGRELDLMTGPWSKHRARWRDPDDYSDCQALGEAVRDQLDAPTPIAAIRYESARRETAACVAVFDPRSLRLDTPARQQTWSCKASADRVLFVRDEERLEYRFGTGAQAG